ncbi:paired amphipathic helix [Mycena filopes]|nr:paired amphipathic helix [Mycena filopes]
MNSTQSNSAASNSASPEATVLNITDALSYLDAVKSQYHDQPEVYERFLDIMKQFKNQGLDTPGVVEQISELFQGNKMLIRRFGVFLPEGYGSMPDGDAAAAGARL